MTSVELANCSMFVLRHY